jgi:hypothetical protein
LLDIFENEQENRLLRGLAYQSIFRAVKKKHPDDFPPANELATFSEEMINQKIIRRVHKRLKKSVLNKSEF